MTFRRCGGKVPIHITLHNFQLSPALRSFIAKKFSALSRFAGDMLDAEIFMGGKRGTAHQFSVSAQVALPGLDLQGNATHANLYGAIDQLSGSLARLARN